MMYRDHGTAEGILSILAPRIRLILLDWLERHLGETETIDIHQWQGPLFYVLVDDSRFDHLKGSARVAGSRVGFTVDIRRQVIYGNTDTTFNHSNGNCFVRSAKWKSLIVREFSPHLGKDGLANDVHWYITVHPPKDAGRS